MAPAPSTPNKLPPTGPKALRIPNGHGSTSHDPTLNGPGGRKPVALPATTRAPPSGPRSNGFAQALPAESSRQAQKVSRPPSPPQGPPPPPRSPSPVRRKSPQKGFQTARPMEDVQRAKISISFALPNGKPRPLPPHQANGTHKSPTAQFFPVDPPASRDHAPVSPRSERTNVRPPSSPKHKAGLLGRRPPTPPPPQEPPPPPPPSQPSPVSRAPSSPRRPGAAVRRPSPPPPSEIPPPPDSPPRQSTLPSPPSESLSAPPPPPREDAPPAFHFRELPEIVPPPAFHFRELAREESEESEEEPAPERVASPELGWVAPSAAFRRVNSGSYYVVGGPLKVRSGKSGEARRNPSAYTRYDGVERDGSLVESKDPRLKSNAWKRGVGSASQVSKFHQISYQWDENTSVGPKPPDPPTAVLITGISPLTTADQIRKFLAPYGRIRDLDVKMDKRSGSQLGICWVKFDGAHHGKGGSAHDVAKAVCKGCDGQRISLMADEKIRVVLDGRGLRAEKAVKEEMERKYAPKPKPPVIAVAPETPLPARPPLKPAPVPFHRTAPRPWQSRGNLPPRPVTQQLSSSFTDRPFARHNRFERDTYRGRSSNSSYSRSRSRRSDSSDSDNEHRRSPFRKLQREPERGYDEDAEKALQENGHPALFIDISSLPTTVNNEGPLHDHFEHFKPSRILRQSQGWYILFANDTAAGHTKNMLDNTRINGRKITMSLKDQASKASAVGSTLSGKGWKHLSFKNRQPIQSKRPPRPPSPPRLPSPESEDEVSHHQSKAEPKRALSPEPERPEELKTTPEPVIEAKKRKAKPVAKAVKKARLDVEMSLPVVEVPPTIDKKSKAKPQTPLEKLITDGVIEDEEDAYWLGQVLANEMAEEEQAVVISEDHPLHHLSGSWRAEGFKRIPKTQKSDYLPQRNRAQASAEEAGALTTGRTARVTGRRLVQDMTIHKSITAESDLFAFNQLRIRKKQLKFARSAIEGYGLYAQETIQPGEMVCEYVGELVRSSVADLREHQYLKQGIGSSYLFRIDGDVVCDATFRGSVSRLINHSCDPSATAKIISINGQSKIVIYAKRMLHPGEEILYDYKFPLESDPALRVPCLCGAETCRGWLN